MPEARHPINPDELHRYDDDDEWPQTFRTFARRIRQENADLREQIQGRDRQMRFTPDFTPIDGASVFIQWKGTDVCLTFRCECGSTGHFDGSFAYQLRCGSCGRVWDMPHSFALIPQRRFDHEVIQDVEMDPDDD